MRDFQNAFDAALAGVDSTIVEVMGLCAQFTSGAQCGSEVQGVFDDQPFDRQIVIPAVAFSGAKHEREHTDIYSSCRLIVRKNGAEIYNRTALDNTLIYSGVIDMPAGHGHMTLEFSVSAWLVNNWYPTASISD
ncbi:hypothetical protein ABNA11_004946, partial [Escherichia coli]|nr:hypothetical protein [Escherichia coli]HAW8651504.1 hypothetical protein [Escherichia coli]HCB7801391.1 hypothetical protein [Escherichia coli]